MKSKLFIILLIGWVCTACQSNTSTSSASDYAMGFRIEQRGDSAELTILSPWQEGQIMSQLTCPLSSSQYQRIICTSATHIGFIRELGMMDYVVGVTSPDRIYSLSPVERLRITDIGDDIHLNMEALLLCQPDLVIISTYAQGDSRAAQIESLGIPVIYCHEWTERTPLARAEWIRMFGTILGCLPKADSIYHSVHEAYTQSKVDSLKTKGASIMSGMSWRGTWYVPAGQTFMGTLFRDAGAQYKYADHPSTSSIPLSMEQALQDFVQADVWVGCEAESLSELAAIDKNHTWFKAYQTGCAYNFQKRSLPSGANDFWESGVVHPERLLHDLQHILAGDTTQLYYTKRLK